MVRGSSRNFSKIHDWALCNSVPSKGAGRGLSSVDDIRRLSFSGDYQLQILINKS
jgi:hypothetical protein